MRREEMTAAAWCLITFLVCELLAASIIGLYTIYPCLWPFSHVLTTCQPLPFCTNPPCVRKCCPEDEHLFRLAENSTSLCEPTDSLNFTVTIVPLSGAPTHPDYSVYTVIHFGLCPSGMFELDPATEEDDHVQLLPDGSLIRMKSKNVIPLENYCLDNHEGTLTKVFKCFDDPVIAELSKEEREVFPITLTLSVPFLVLTGAVYLLLPELHNLHGFTLLCHVSGLAIGCGFLSLVQWNIYEMNTAYPNLCVFVAFVIQFSFLATFFWLNVMCFDIWWVFSGLRPLRGSVKQREHKKFILYSLYAWGCPLLIFGISLLMETAPFIPDSYIKPRFGTDKCWFKDWQAMVLYFYLPIGVLILLNIVMFVTTAIRLRAHSKDTNKVIKGSESRRTDESERQRFNLYLKLFIVMGINWVTELISFAVGGPKYIWFITDIGNTLQGLLIFLIFVWKRRILRLLNQKLCPRWKLVAPAQSSSSRSKTDKPDVAKTASTDTGVVQIMM